MYPIKIWTFSRLTYPTVPIPPSLRPSYIYAAEHTVLIPFSCIPHRSLISDIPGKNLVREPVGRTATGVCVCVVKRSEVKEPLLKKQKRIYFMKHAPHTARSSG
jgi:hypothetical protein